MILAVLDTNVIVAALRSDKGASHELLRQAELGSFQPVLSVALVAEYEDVLFRPETGVPLSRERIDAILDWLCETSLKHSISFLWRPFLPDPADDMVFELAFGSGARYIVTFNLADFRPATRFGIEPILPKDFLMIL